MRVELADDAADRTLDDLLVVDDVDILAAHTVDDLGHQRGGLDRRVERGRWRFRASRESRPSRAADREAEAEHDARE